MFWPHLAWCGLQTQIKVWNFLKLHILNYKWGVLSISFETYLWNKAWYIDQNLVVCKGLMKSNSSVCQFFLWQRGCVIQNTIKVVVWHQHPPKGSGMTLCGWVLAEFCSLAKTLSLHSIMYNSSIGKFLLVVPVARLKPMACCNSKLINQERYIFIAWMWAEWMD